MPMEEGALREPRLGCTPSRQEVEDAIQVALARLSSRGYRRTPLLQTVLREMAAHHSPVTISELMTLPDIGESDPSSTYRLLKRLETEGIVTRLGIGYKAPYYLMVMPGHQHAYLVCKNCGILEETASQPVERRDESASRFAPWTDVKPELWYTGICPECR